MSDDCKIERVQYGLEDHGMLTCWVYVGGEGWAQGFGGLWLTRETGPDFVTSLCETFGVRDVELLPGHACRALRGFNFLNAPIDGLESVATGRRFLIQTWRRKHHPDTPTRLVDEQRNCLREIASMEQRLTRALADLAALPTRYVELEGAPIDG